MQKYLIITHKLFQGAGQDFYKYCKKQGFPALLVEHPFASYPDRRTVFSYYNGNVEQVTKGLNYSFLPESACYLKDFLYSLSVAARFAGAFDTCIGCGGFNALAGLILRALRKTRKVVFYTIDYAPRRFSNKALNNFYHAIDKLCVRRADRTWNLSARMAQGRAQHNNMPQNIFNRQRLVPVGIWQDTLPEARKNIVKDKTLIFCGDISQTQGLQMVLDAIPQVSAQVQNFKFLIIGEGAYRKSLEDKAAALGITSQVEFLGPVYEQNALLKLLCAARAGIAAYMESRDSQAYYADVTKPKTYLSCGLPVIITRMPWIHDEVDKRAMGIVVESSKESIAGAITRLMNDDALYTRCKKNAEEYVRTLDWNTIFTNALEELNHD